VEDFQLQYISANLMQTPEIAVLQAQKETMRFAENVCGMFSMFKQLFKEEDKKKFAELYSKIEHEENFTDRMELEIARYLEQVSNDHLSDDTKMKIRQMMREVGELESIGDVCFSLARTMKRSHEMDRNLTSEQVAQLDSMIELCDNALSQMCVVLKGHRLEHDMREAYEIESHINQKRDRMRVDNLSSVNEREYDYVVGAVFMDLVAELEKLGDYVVNVVEARVGK
jgi:phosphate:Na+ symporter